MSNTSSAVATGSVERSEAVRPEPTGPLATTSSTTPAEGTAVSGSMPTIIPYLYMHWIFQTAFTWSSDLKPGSILWSIPLSPLFMNYVIRYFSAIHNIWQGSFDFELWMAGTGFNGGKLVFFWCPPNYNLDEFTLEMATTFAHVEIDPKMNTPIPISGKDFCLQKAHVMRNSNVTPDITDPDFISEYARIGGYLGIMVMNPLINASETKTAVNVSIMNKAGEDFRLFQIVPPPKGLPPTLSLPDFTVEGSVVPYLDTYQIKAINVSTKSATVSIDVALLRDIHTKKYSRNPDKVRLTSLKAPYNNQPWTVVSGVTSVRDDDLPHNLSIKGNFSLDNNVNHVGNSDWGICGFYKGSPTEKRQYFDAGTAGNTQIYIGSNENSESGGLGYGYFNTLAYAPGVDLKPWTVESDIGESLVTFGSVRDNDGAGCCTTSNLDGYIRYCQFEKSGDPIFSVVDKSTKLPLFLVRLNPEGFFTAAKVSTIVTAKAEDVYFKFEYYLRHSTALPTVTPVNLGHYQLTSKLKQLAVYEKKMESFLDLQEFNPEYEEHSEEGSEHESDALSSSDEQ